MFVVADGYSFCTARGVIKPGAEIKESDFAKKETFQKKVEQGRIVLANTKEQEQPVKAAKSTTAKDKQPPKEDSQSKEGSTEKDKAKEA